MDLLDLRHHLAIDVQATGGVDDNHVDELELGFTDGGLGDLHRLLADVGGEEGDPHLPGQGFQLLDGGRAVDVGGDDHDGLLLAFLEEARQLARGGGLPRALQAGHEDDRRRRDVERQILVRRAHDGFEFGAHDLHEGLPRRQALGHLGADRPLLDPVDELLDHRQGDVRLEQRHAHLAQGVLDVVFGELGLAGNVAQALGQAVCEILEHADIQGRNGG
ncbi:hypothetical protein QE393_002956 [Pseudomonas sp. SORGH_AS 211]|nr:hypothetical protein [Pseudomonas sp. SORGH_AS_0211]